MRVEVTIACDNLAFTPDPGFEVSRILRELADKIDKMGMPASSPIKIYDVNGSSVGHFVTKWDTDTAN